jgi:hypothetical protein
VIQFDQGPPLVAITDKTWKTTQREEKGWTDPQFDDSAWLASLELGGYGMPPWGLINENQLTIGPVKAADPFRAHFTIPADVQATKCRLCLEMEALPDDSAAVHLNGVYAGGVIGRPPRLDITRYLKAGENTVLIEPLAPKSVRIVCYDAAEQ